MTAYSQHLPLYLREDTGKNAREWENRLREWYKNNESLPTHHWTQVGYGSSTHGIFKLSRVQDKDPQLSMSDWKHEPAMHVLTKRTSTHGTEIVSAGFIRVTPLSLPHDEIRDVSLDAREKDLKERQDWITEPFDSETLKHIDRIYKECVREHVSVSLRDGLLTLLRGELCVPHVEPPSPYRSNMEHFCKALVRRANLRKRTAKDVSEAINRDMRWP